MKKFKSVTVLLNTSFLPYKIQIGPSSLIAKLSKVTFVVFQTTDSVLQSEWTEKSATDERGKCHLQL